MEIEVRPPPTVERYNGSKTLSYVAAIFFLVVLGYSISILTGITELRTAPSLVVGSTVSASTVLFTVLSAIGSALFLSNLLPGGYYLETDREGFVVRRFGKKRRYSWIYCSRFSAGRPHGTLFSPQKAMFGYAPPSERLVRAVPDLVANPDRALPGNFGMGVDELVALMNNKRHQAFD